MVSGDKHRINYILLKLVKNSIERTFEAHKKKILVKCSMMNGDEVSNILDNDLIRLSDCSEVDFQNKGMNDGMSNVVKN